ncbi:MAG: hypothetical protein COA58_10820 [Bacteroidetes bacterium]|nr:MAG: hypothetical protein COA58_10820 [Bacteroidota bacterium]
MKMVNQLTPIRVKLKLNLTYNTKGKVTEYYKLDYWGAEQIQKIEYNDSNMPTKVSFIYEGEKTAEHIFYYNSFGILFYKQELDVNCVANRNTHYKFKNGNIVEDQWVPVSGNTETVHTYTFDDAMPYNTANPWCPNANNMISSKTSNIIDEDDQGDYNHLNISYTYNEFDCPKLASVSGLVSGTLRFKYNCK